jgi:hypothetical protein
LKDRSRGSRQSTSTASNRRGPRGGRTTVTPGGLTRVSTYLDRQERTAVRERAFEEERSISDVIRSAVRHYLKLR